jgi:hypothetical protein
VSKTEEYLASLPDNLRQGLGVMPKVRMPEDVKAEWVRRLRSGKYAQGQQRLRTETMGPLRFCCLGVLCEVLTDQGRLRRNRGHYELPSGGGGSSTSVPSYVQGYLTGHPEDREFSREWSEFQNVLITMNDGLGADFSTIADVVEENA